MGEKTGNWCRPPGYADPWGLWSNENRRIRKGGIQERTIKAGIGLNEDHPEGQGLKKFKELVEKKSGGKMKVQNFYSATLGDDQK